MLFSFTLVVLHFLVAAGVNVHASFPEPFELSFSDEPRDSCNYPPKIQPNKTVKSNISLCFADLEEAAENLLRWRVMFTSFKMENKTAFIDLRIRRVVIFAPGASFTMAGAPPVSVFSRLRELKIGIHYNGFGEVSDPTNSSIIFKGQLNTTVFEGHIIYQSLNRSHTIRCFHDNNLGPDFYQANDCLACVFTTYDTHHNPDSSFGWRSNGQSPCKKDFVDQSNQSKFTTQPGIDTDSKNEDSLGFPQTGFSDYNRNTSDQHVPDKRVSDSMPVIDGAPRVDAKSISASELGTETDNLGQQKSNQSFQSFSGVADKRKTIESSTNKPKSISPLMKNCPPKTSSATISSSKSSHPQNDVTDDREIQTPSSNEQRDTYSRTSHSVSQQISRFPRSTDNRPVKSYVSRSDKEAHPRRRQYRKRSMGGNDQRTLRTTRSAKLQPKPSRSSNQSYTETISCPLHLVADHLFFSEVGEKSPAKTVNLMLSVVIGADAVFRATDFDGDGVRDNIGFMVKNITIIHNSSMAFYHYSRTNGNSFQYLKSFSTGDFSDVCLGVAFTAIDFQRGVVGLAWYASSQTGGAGKGGICGRRVYLANEGSSFSFNTAIVSFLNHGSGVSMEKAILTMAHEFGHCFGSTHDDMEGSPCNKDYSRGSYLMQTYRPSQYLPNHYKFSPCSLRQMYPVITHKGGCLLRYTGPTCGNGMVEEGEECDCGLSGACQFNDPCCSPGDASLSSADPPCTLRRSLGLECSPVTFSCCSDACKHISLADRYVCREAGDCYSQARCDGRSPLCPTSSFLAEGTLCHGGIRTCVQGRCHRSLCWQAGLEDCFCQNRPEDRCKLCCRRRDRDDARGSGGCQPALVFNITSGADHLIYLPEGDACLDYRGICTVSRGKNKDKTFCVTTDSLDGEPFSALIGLRWSGDGEGDSGDGGGGGGGVTWLRTSWFYLLLVPLLPALITGLLLCSRGVLVRFRSVSKDDDKMANSNMPRQLSALIAAGQAQPDVFRQETEKASSLRNMKSSPPHAFQHQRQFQLPQQRQHSPIVSPTNILHKYYGRRNQQETALESSKNRSVNTSTFPRYHSERLLLSARKAGFQKQRAQHDLKRSLSVLDSASSNTSDVALSDHYQEQRRPRDTAVGLPFAQLHQLCGARPVSQNSGPLYTRHGYRNQRNLGPSGRRLRAIYSKPFVRCRTYPMEASFKRSETRARGNNTKVRCLVGDHCHLNGRNSQVFFDRERSNPNVFRHGPVHEALSFSSSESS